jgi:hypothetical protein
MKVTNKLMDADLLPPDSAKDAPRRSMQRLVRRCAVWNETQGTCHTPDTYEEERARYPAMVMWDLGWEQSERDGWRNPLTDPPTQTGKILVWLADIGPAIVNVEERWMCFWNGHDETGPTSPDEWTAWREILPPNKQNNNRNHDWGQGIPTH